MSAIASPPRLSVVIPTLDAAETLPATLAALDEAGVGALLGEIVIADGGSRDRTIALAVSKGARTIAAPRGRGLQLAAGAAAAAGTWLMFLHADTRLAPGWSAAVSRFIADPSNAGRAGYFALRLDDTGAWPRWIARGAAWRARVLGLPYGDQGLVIAADFYRRVGGFAELPLMEDVALARAIGRRNLVPLDGTAVTSAARYRRDGYCRRVARNLGCLGLYLMGCPPRFILRLYG